MPKDAILIMRFPSDVKAALRLASEDDGRSMSKLALDVLSEWLAGRGYLPASGAPRHTRQKARA